MIESAIVDSSKRKVCKIANWRYMYIPLSKEEKLIFADDIINIKNPCWLIYKKGK